MMLRWAASVWMLLLGAGCASTSVVRLDTGQGQPLEYTPPTRDLSVAVPRAAFEEALQRLLLEMPLSIRSAQAGLIVRTASPFAGVDHALEAWQTTLGKGYGRWCRAYEAPNDCLSLLEDGLGFSSMDRLTLAVGLAIEPMKQSIAEAVEQTLSPRFFYAVAVAGIVSWVALAANPEPVFTKAAAVVAAVLMAYLGGEAFLEVVKACFELRQATDRATTFQELEQAGRRFGGVLGDKGSRVLILAVTLVLSRGTAGGTSWLAARIPLLPSFAEASAVGASQVGIRLEAVGQVSRVAVAEGKLAITLAPTALAMAAQGTNGGGTPVDRSFKSFDSFKRTMGPAGFKKQWHHIMEQTDGNVARFGPEAIHNTKNVIPLDEATHREVSRFYSQIRRDLTGSETLTLRKWLSTQSLEEQRRFGLLAIENVRKGLWP